MRNLYRAALSACVTLLLASSALAQRCDIKIIAPKPEEAVEEQGDVIGTANIPNDTFLWVLTRRNDQPKTFYWPQQGLEAKDVNGEPQWKISTHYGVPADSGHNFKVIVVVVDKATNQHLENWREQAPSKNYAPFVGMPASVAGCDPVEVIVKKSQ